MEEWEKEERQKKKGRRQGVKEEKGGGGFSSLGVPRLGSTIKYFNRHPAWVARTVHAGAGGREPFPWPVLGRFLGEGALKEEEDCKAGAWLRVLAARSAEPSLNPQLESRG